MNYGDHEHESLSFDGLRDPLTNDAHITMSSTPAARERRSRDISRSATKTIAMEVKDHITALLVVTKFIVVILEVVKGGLVHWLAS